ncbi:MAG: Nif11-like leader peptide family natural product precursor [Clostridia bacterium]|nr:Nif11-like leader peptide family natural product precursor [Clostridia bacterium]
MNDILLEMRAHALRDPAFRRKLLDSRNTPDFLTAFCQIAGEYGYVLTPGELISDGEEFSSNQTKSTNGGNPLPYDCFDDPVEMFLISIS